MLDFILKLSSLVALVSFVSILRPFPSLQLPTRKRALVVFLVACVTVAWARTSQEGSGEVVLTPEEQEKKALVDSFLAIEGKKLGTEEFYQMRKKYGTNGDFENLKSSIPTLKVGYSEELDVSYIFNTRTEEIVFTGKGKSAEKHIREKIEKGFSKWDGSHKELTKRIKSMMNDPSSYDHIETKFWTYREHIDVETKFRGTNAYGAVVQDKVMARVGYEGEVLEISSLRGPTLSTEKFGSKLH